MMALLELLRGYRSSYSLQALNLTARNYSNFWLASLPFNFLTGLCFGTATGGPSVTDSGFQKYRCVCIAPSTVFELRCGLLRQYWQLRHICCSSNRTNTKPVRPWTCCPADWRWGNQHCDYCRYALHHFRNDEQEALCINAPVCK